MKNNILFILIIFLITSCIKKEIPVSQHISGTGTETQIEMGQDYRKQLFYSLKNNSVIKSNNKEEWDLGFESSTTGWHIILNSSRRMAASKNQANFADITDADNLSWNWDAHTGNLDSTAIDNWLNENYLYIIDMGYNHLGIHLGYKKLKCLEMDEDQYTIEFGDLIELTASTTSILKNSSTLFTYYKFGVGEIDIAPINSKWDLQFTQYTHLFTNPSDAYLVTGVLLNRLNTSAAKITSKTFEEINFYNAEDISYSSDISYIGYNWKWYNFTTSLYTVDSETTYLVKTAEGLIYKLHFIDFYNELGIKGYPKMEIQKL